MLTLPHTPCALVLRIDFTDEEAWDAVCAASIAPSVDGFAASLYFVSDSAFADLSPEQVATLPMVTYRSFLFLVDDVTVTDPGNADCRAGSASRARSLVPGRPGRDVECREQPLDCQHGLFRVRGRGRPGRGVPKLPAVGVGLPGSGFRDDVRCLPERPTGPLPDRSFRLRDRHPVDVSLDTGGALRRPSQADRPADRREWLPTAGGPSRPAGAAGHALAAGDRPFGPGDQRPRSGPCGTSCGRYKLSTAYAPIASTATTPRSVAASSGSSTARLIAVVSRWTGTTSTVFAATFDRSWKPPPGGWPSPRCAPGPSWVGCLPPALSAVGNIFERE